MERVVEEIETQCYSALKGVQAAGMEYDEDVVCDVCRMVSLFCSFSSLLPHCAQHCII